MAVNFLSSVPKLKGRENYSDWSFAVQNMLVLDDLKTCLDGSETSETKDEKAKAKLILTIDPSLFVHVKDATSTKDLWTKLQKLFDDKGFCRKIGLLRALISIRLENCDSMECYVTQLIETAQKLKGTGFQIDDSWIGSLLLAGLPEKYAPMIMAIEHSGIQLTVDSIRTKLLDMEPAGNTGNAFVSATRHQGKRHSGNTAGSSNVLGSFESGDVKEANLKNVKCFRCEQMGHYKNRCPITNKNTGNKSSNAFSAVFLSTQFSKDDWYVDSGASRHLTVNSDWLTNVLENFELQDIITANNQRLSVSCVGDINIVTVVNRNSHDITITNAIENTKGYRVYDPEVGSVSTSRDVVIIEKAEEVPITINSEPVGDNDTTEVIISEDTDTGSESEHSSVRNDEEEIQSSDTEFLPGITLRDQTNSETIEAIRRSSRVPKPKSFEDFVTYNCMSGDVDVDPANVDEALSGPEKEQWRQAMKEEYQSFMDNEAWEITEAPDGANVVDCKWVYKKKKNIDGSPCDVAILKPMKQYWKEEARRHKQTTSKAITKGNFAPEFKEAFDKGCKKQTIMNGFRACGLDPFSEDAVDYSKYISVRRGGNEKC
ncbi:hypothetical protein JTB14_028881 [Gonioctena quinquepunctata]|nr:hypothetical protein JTB14_028881 [Gonioctena quinquepunctata]